MSNAISRIRIVPELRTSVLEQPSPPDIILWRSLKADIDLKLLARSGSVQQFTWRSFLWCLVREPITDVELPEPLWAKQVPFLLALSGWTKVLAPLATRSTHALEVLPLSERFALPNSTAWGSMNRPWRALLGAYAWLAPRLFDYIGYATQEAEHAYNQSFRMSSVSSSIVGAWQESCSCGPFAKQKILFFAAEPSARKGFDLLLAAWEVSGLLSEGWRLHCALPVEKMPESQTLGSADLILNPSRENLHKEFSASYATVLPSRRERRWKEQIGLSLTEGRSHGNWLVCSSDVPLSREIDCDNLGKVFESGSVPRLASALCAIAGNWPTLPPVAPAGHPRERFNEGYRSQSK